MEKGSLNKLLEGLPLRVHAFLKSVFIMQKQPPEMSYKKMFLKISLESTCVKGHSDRMTVTEVFSSEYCEMFKNTYFEEHQRTAGSDYGMAK